MVISHWVKKTKNRKQKITCTPKHAKHLTYLLSLCNSLREIRCYSFWFIHTFPTFCYVWGISRLWVLPLQNNVRKCASPETLVARTQRWNLVSATKIYSGKTSIGNNEPGEAIVAWDPFTDKGGSRCIQLSGVPVVIRSVLDQKHQCWQSCRASVPGNHSTL